MADGPIDLSGMPTRDLLRLQADLQAELRSRDIMRTANGLTGDLAERIFCDAFGWKPAPNSEKAFDAIDQAGRRFQIKGRRLERPSSSRQLSAIRTPSGFDILACVLFDAEYSVIRGALVPSEVVAARIKHVEHVNAYRFMLQDVVWTLPGVVDVTAELTAALDDL